MTSTTTLAFAPHQPSPLARTTSPFKDPRTPPCTPRTPTAKLWDEYERRAMENARRRETTCGSSLQSPQLQRFSSGAVFDIIKKYDPHSSQYSPRISGISPTTSATESPNFEFGFPGSARHRGRADSVYSTTVAICKTCKEAISSSSGICEKCMKTIVISSTSGESTPPLGPACRNFASTDLPKLHKESTSGTTTPAPRSPKRKSRRSSSTQLADPPIRLSSLRPLRTCENPKSSSEAPRPRKSSLTDPNEAFMRLQIARKPVPIPRTLPVSPTTLPSTSHSHVSNTRTRCSSLANVTEPSQFAHPRHASATPSELSTMAPCTSNTTTSPPSVSRASYNLENQTSAWDWDSDDEEEKAGLVGYWRARKWRGSRGSLGGTSGKRDIASKEESVKEECKRKRRGFVRVISCGCGEE
jgi:hypothetical protein